MTNDITDLWVLYGLGDILFRFYFFDLNEVEGEYFIRFLTKKKKKPNEMSR